MATQSQNTFVIQRRNKTTGEVRYLSPGKVNWVSVANHEKYGTRYGGWVQPEAEEIATLFNTRGNPEYDYFALPKGEHK